MLGSVKVLIVKLSAFGDIIHSLPALDDLLARPEIKEVHWLVDSRFAFVTEVFPEQVKVHQVDFKGAKPLSAVLTMVKKLRAEKFDMAFDLQGLMKSAVVARLICKTVYGFDSKIIREKPAAWLQTSISFHAQAKHVVQVYRNIVQTPWFETITEAEIAYLPPSIHKNITILPLPDGLMSEKPIVMLHLGGAWQTKILPDQTWLDIAKGAVEKGYQVVWCWGNVEEQSKAQQLSVASVGIVLKERQAMLKLCSLLKQVAFIVGADTGVLHLAAALGTPSISFWGPSASWRSAPLGLSDKQVESKPKCGPCFKRSCNDFICMDMIKADDIVSHL